MNYEKVLELARENGLEVIENYDLSDTRFKGLYCDGTVALRSDLKDSVEKSCVLMEEIGHHKTSTGNILHIKDECDTKQELRARRWACDNSILIKDIVDAHKYGCRNTFEIAQYLGVTEKFLIDTINHYKKKYGIYASYDNCVVYLDRFGVLELYK